MDDLTSIEYLPPTARALAEANPDATGYVGEAFNEYGTPVTLFRCTACERWYTLCPAIKEDRRDQWEECLGPKCPSYDITRDVEVFWGALGDHGLIGREEPNG